MPGWIIALSVLVVLAIYVVRRATIRKDRRRRVRQARRRRNRIHQRLWDQIMVRPRIKQLTFDDRDS